MRQGHRWQWRQEIYEVDLKGLADQTGSGHEGAGVTEENSQAGLSLCDLSWALGADGRRALQKRGATVANIIIRRTGDEQEDSPHSPPGLRDLSHKGKGERREGLQIPDPLLMLLRASTFPPVKWVAPWHLEAIQGGRKVELPRESRVCIGLVPLPPGRPSVKEQCEYGMWVIPAQLLASEPHLHNELHSTQLS